MSDKPIPISTNPISKAIDGDNSFNNSHEILVYFCYRNDDTGEGRIGLFNSCTCSVEEIAKFSNLYAPYQVATTQDKIFGINNRRKSFEIYDLNTRQISRGPDPPEWRIGASVAYFKDKLYYLGGDMNRVDVLIDGKWQTGSTFPVPIRLVQTMACNGILYVIDGYENGKIFLLSDDEREWVEIVEIPEGRKDFRVASLNRGLYITGGWSGVYDASKSCLCFDPSAPVDSQMSRVADMNCARYNHSLVVANGKLYAIGGFQNIEKKSDGLYQPINFCDSIEEYDPQTNKWQEVGNIDIK